jgi:hypothetical protein
MARRPKAIEMTDAAAKPHTVSTYAFSGCLAPWFPLVVEFNKLLWKGGNLPLAEFGVYGFLAGPVKVREGPGEPAHDEFVLVCNRANKTWEDYESGVHLPYSTFERRLANEIRWLVSDSDVREQMATLRLFLEVVSNKRREIEMVGLMRGILRLIPPTTDHEAFQVLHNEFFDDRLELRLDRISVVLSDNEAVFRRAFEHFLRSSINLIRMDDPRAGDRILPMLRNCLKAVQGDQPGARGLLTELDQALIRQAESVHKSVTSRKQRDGARA